jgi:ABC-2 type transport system ATP-binding protein
MGRTKAVIFSTHILEEVDAACTRAIIIDRGRIVANGTPEELRDMSDLAGAVTLSAKGATDTALAALPEVLRVEHLDEHWLRIYPKDKHAQVALAQTIMDLARSKAWHVYSLHTEEGQLDEVFRRITLPDTVAK